jgi:hypothetical protein
MSSTGRSSPGREATTQRDGQALQVVEVVDVADAGLPYAVTALSSVGSSYRGLDPSPRRPVQPGGTAVTWYRATRRRSLGCSLSSHRATLVQSSDVASSSGFATRPRCLTSAVTSESPRRRRSAFGGGLSAPELAPAEPMSPMAPEPPTPAPADGPVLDASAEPEPPTPAVPVSVASAA